MEHLDLKHATIVGVSLGGWIAAEMAVKSTQRIDANARVKKEEGPVLAPIEISSWILLTLRGVASVGTDVLELFPGDFIYGHCYRM